MELDRAPYVRQGAELARMGWGRELPAGEEIEEGWIIGLNFRDHVIEEMQTAQIDYYINLGGSFQDTNWRKFNPIGLFEHLNQLVAKRLQA